MMTLKFREIAERQGIKNAKQLARVSGINVTSCYQLWNGTAKMISFEALNTLCNVLQAGPAILLGYTPDVDASGGETPPAQNEATEKKTGQASGSSAKKSGRASRKARSTAAARA